MQLTFGKFLVLAAAFVCSSAQVSSVGKCLQVDVVKDFDISKYVGVWYEYERYPTVFEISAKCVTATYTANPDGSVKVFNQMIHSESGEKRNITGTATFSGAANEAKLTVAFPIARAKGSYWVLGTDYENFSVVWSCTPMGDSNLVAAWVLTRKANPSEETVRKAYEIIEKNKVDKTHFSRTSHENC